MPTLHQYRRTFDLRNENHPWSGLPDDVFLKNIGEKAGSGADTIRKGWNDNGWVTPAIIEKYNPDSVTLVLSLEETSDKQAINKR